MEWSVQIAVIGAVLTAVLAFIGARRLNSGKVDTSSAERLWAAAEKMREEYAIEALEARRASREETAALRNDVRVLRAEVASLRDEAHLKDREISKLQQEIIDVRKLNEELEFTVNEKTIRIVTLETEVAGLKRGSI